MHPVDHGDAGAEFLPQGLGAGAGAVRQTQFRHTRIQQRGDHGARRPAGPKDRSRAGSRIPARHILAQVGHESISVGVVRMDSPVCPEDQRVGGADQRGAVGYMMGEAESGFLVRDGDVGTDESHPRQSFQHLFEIVLGDVERHIMPPQAIDTQPMTVQPRRQRMRHRRADDTGQWNSVTHVSITPMVAR
jgi:hypothetical protein